MNVESYLERIGAARPAAPTAETLADLQLAHLYTVPFENLSIHWGEPIVLDIERFADKIVGRRRGGFCYELNGAFGALLGELGYNVTMVSAGVARPTGGFGPNYDHMALVVRCPSTDPVADAPGSAFTTTESNAEPGAIATGSERWLVDVGFGDSFLTPLRLDSREIQIRGRMSYRIVDVDGALVLEQRDGDGEWMPEYRFTDEPRALGDYDEMCAFHQTSPESHFTQKRITSRARPSGRVTLSNNRLIETGSDGRKTESDVKAEDVERVLLDVFGIRGPSGPQNRSR